MKTNIRKGTVYLVGAGPGNPDLITVRGLRLLQQADVVVYDRLVHPELLESVRPGAERIYVGKAPGRHAADQEDINAVLVAKAREGHAVVRLKGGDPFVYGRGGEEGLELSAARIPFDVVPGISSTISVPAYAGIPVTHRGVSGSFTVVTGHRCGDAVEDPDWEALARSETLVVLMGLGNLAAIAGSLVRHGRSADTPAAVIRCGTTEDQEVVVGTLADIAQRAATLRPPATVVVGEVVRLREHLQWFEAAGPTGQFPAVKPLPTTHITPVAA
jgi:uroporphyrin-III C-methyltransferase